MFRSFNTSADDLIEFGALTLFECLSFAIAFQSAGIRVTQPDLTLNVLFCGAALFPGSRSAPYPSVCRPKRFPTSDMFGQTLLRVTYGCACKFSFVNTPSHRDSTDRRSPGPGLESDQNMQRDLQEPSVHFRSKGLSTDQPRLSGPS